MNNQQNNIQPQQNQSFWQLDKSKAAKVGQSSYINGNTSEIYQIASAAWKSRVNDQTRVENYYLTLHIMNSDKSMAHVDIYYGNSDGEKWSGENMINAIMLCGNVPNLSQSQGQFMEYDFDQKKDVLRNGLVSPELIGTKVGLFLADNHYYNQNQGAVKRGGLNVFNVFDAQTRQLPNEKASNTPASSDTFDAVTDAMLKSSQKSLDDANAKAGISPNAPTQFNNQMSSQGGQQNGGVTYQRGAPVQQGGQQQGNAPAANMPNGPIDDGIPF